MLKSMESLYRGAAENWCRFAHAEPMWPVNGEYRCPTCHRTYEVPWANTASSAKPLPVTHRIPSLANHPKAA